MRENFNIILKWEKLFICNYVLYVQQNKYMQAYTFPVYHVITMVIQTRFLILPFNKCIPFSWV